MDEQNEYIKDLHKTQNIDFDKNILDYIFQSNYANIFSLYRYHLVYTNYYQRLYKINQV